MKSSRNLLVLIGVIFLALCLIGHSARQSATARAENAERVENPYLDSTILVEAFMVKVRLSELYELGLPRISEGSKFASAEQILKCLKKPNAAEIAAGAKLAVAHGRQAETNSTFQKGMYSGTAEGDKLTFVEVGTRLKVTAEIVPEGKIFSELEFQHSDLEESEAGEDVLPSLTERNWSNSISLIPGKPTLAGATQGEEIAEFLIVTANIQK